MTKRSYARGILAAFGAVALCFFGSTLYVNWRHIAIDAGTESLETNALPSIELLTVASEGVRDIEAASDEYPELGPEPRAEARRAIERKRRDVERQLASYQRLTASEAEVALFEPAVPEAMRALDQALDRLFFLVEEGQIAAAQSAADHDVRPKVIHLAAHFQSLIAFNTRLAREDVARIDSVRRSGARVALILDAIAMLIVVTAAASVLRLFRAHERLLMEHGALVEKRANDLELFGKRVAHDLLSPISALTYCLGAFKRVVDTDPKLVDAMARARSCVARAQALVDGVFEFSRSGGQPVAGASSDVRQVLDEVAAEVRMAEDAECPEITIAPFETLAVACHRGVLTSIMTNLMRNAVKYMKDSAVKRITVRVLDKRSMVRIEVEDTGPGVPAGLERSIFEPYVRAEGVTQPGLGLGLATVKRFCEAHGGQVGVVSTEGRGSTFWFTLPKASAVVKRLERVASA